MDSRKAALHDLDATLRNLDEARKALEAGDLGRLITALRARQWVFPESVWRAHREMREAQVSTFDLAPERVEVPVDDRLLAPCTADLLRGWTGPVHGYVHRGQLTRAVSIGEFEPWAMLWTEMGDALALPKDLSLDLSLAECRDRVCREGAEMHGWDDLKVSALRNDPVALADAWREVSRG